MARPETIAEVKSRQETIGSLDVSKFSTTPALLKHYTALVEALEKMGGECEASYANVTLKRPKTKEELELQLATDQREWDRIRKLYYQAVKCDPEDEPIREYQQESIKHWARGEGLPDPFDVFAANDPELAEIRKSLGMTNE